MDGTTMTEARDRICVALDGSDREWILATARSLGPRVGWLKIGLEAFTAFGPEIVRELADLPTRVFFDIKLHDIPNTVRRAAANCARTHAAMFNVHASGGRAMLEAAVEGAAGAGATVRPKVIAVTVLTSIDRHSTAELGLGRDPEELVLRWAALAQTAGLDGVVASAREAAAIRRECGPDFLIVAPGIRPKNAASGDQQRVMTPAAAVEAGSDILVIGRPITSADDPDAAIGAILDELAG
jgi:orotidine-5'-phosphate decarboxylase